MTAQPFGGHPTFIEYQDWARDQGCNIKCGVAMKNGRSARQILFEAPNGKWAVEVGTNDDDILVPTSVARLDRRLGLASPFAKVAIDDD